VLELPDPIRLELLAHSFAGLPDEACGLIAARPGSEVVERFYPCANADASSRTYTVDARDHLRADRDADDRGLELIGVVHSHTHTDAYPSPTDVRQAPDPTWHYVIVSLRPPEPAVRSYRIADGEVTEEGIVVVAH
jgi:proteasome lid subunit RPN8/RPN11